MAAALLASAVLVFDPFGWAAFGPLKWALVSALALGAGALTVQGPFQHHLPSTLGWAAFLGWGAVCTVVGWDPVYAWIGTPDRHLGWITWLLFAVVFLVGQNIADQTRLLARSASVAAIGMSVYSLLEIADLAPIQLAVESARAGGTFGSAAYLGAACVLLIPMNAALASDSGEHPAWRAAASLAVIGAGFTVLVSQTRAAWLGLAASALVTAPRWWPFVRRRWWIVLVALVLIVASPLGSRMLDAFNGDLEARVDEWRMGLAVVIDHPIFGVGPEGYRLAFPTVVDAEYERRYTRQATPDRAHNGLLDTAVSFGLLGIASYVAAAIFILGRCWKAVRASDPMTAGIAAALVGYLVQQQFLFPLAEVDVIFWLLAGVVVTRTGSAATVARPNKLVAAFLGLAAVGALGVGALDVTADHQVLASQRQPQAAPAITDRATSLRPDSIRYWLVSANARANAGDFGASITRIDRALSISPLDPILLAAKGQILLGAAGSTGSGDDVARAVTFYRHLLNTDPNNGQNQLRAGTAFALAGNLQAAEDAYRTAAELAPTSPVPLMNLARIYLSEGKLDAAVHAYEAARSIDPTAPGLAQIAVLLEQAGAIID